MEERELTSRSFTAWPAWAELPLDVVAYGPDVPTEADLRLLGRLDGKRVLELGCGGGPISVAMTRQGAKVIAVESSAEQLAHARRLCEREEVAVELHHGDLAELAFVRADTIDLVVSIYALGMVPDLDRVFRQVHRVLPPQGPLVLSLPHPAATLTEGRSWFDRSVSDVFTSLVRTSFAVDVLLEPLPAPGARFPRTLVVRGRKLGS